MDYSPHVGDLVYIKKGRWDSFGMVVEQMTDNRWVIEWYSLHGEPLRTVGYDGQTVSRFHQQYLQMRKKHGF